MIYVFWGQRRWERGGDCLNIKAPTCTKKNPANCCYSNTQSQGKQFHQRYFDQFFFVGKPYKMIRTTKQNI